MSSARVLANRYRLDEHAAEGGMGSVWAATDLQLERRVAVKLMSAAFAEQADARARFLREAQAAAKIQSPHVVSTLDYGVDGSTPYIVMEWLDGESLGARLKRELRLSTSATGVILRQVARGLRSAHELGVVHRDLKPDNLFLQRDHDEEIVKILDFGVAKARGQAGDQTRTGVILGSLRYMSPEQARANRDTDHRSDLWSLGVIAYRCLTGELPFSGASDGDLLVNICTEAPLPASAHLPELAPLDAFFIQCLAKDPAMRFGSAAELAAAYFAALGVDDPSRRTITAEAARGSLPSFSLPPPVAPPQAAAQPAPLPPPQAPPLPAPQPPSQPGVPPLDALVSQPVMPPLGAPAGHAAAPPPSRSSSSGVGQPAWQPASPASSASADPASRSAILVASMPPPGRSSSKLGLAVGIGGAVGVVLALGSLVVLLSTGVGASKSDRGGRAAAATAEPVQEAPPAAPATGVPDPLADEQPEPELEPSTPPPASAAANIESSAATAAPVARTEPSATPRTASSARAGATGSAKSPGTKPLSRPLIPSNPY